MIIRKQEETTIKVNHTIRLFLKNLVKFETENRQDIFLFVWQRTYMTNLILLHGLKFKTCVNMFTSGNADSFNLFVINLFEAWNHPSSNPHKSQTAQPPSITHWEQLRYPTCPGSIKTCVSMYACVSMCLFVCGMIKPVEFDLRSRKHFLGV